MREHKHERELERQWERKSGEMDEKSTVQGGREAGIGGRGLASQCCQLASCVERSSEVTSIRA